MWGDKFFWCFIGHFVVYSWITSLAHGSALKVSEPLYLHVGSKDSDSEMGYIKNMKDDGKKGYAHFESFHNKDGDDYGYEKHEAFGYTDHKDSNSNADNVKDELNEETKVEENKSTVELNDALKVEETSKDAISDNVENAESDLKGKPIVVAEEENQVENYQDAEDEESSDDHNPDSEDHQPAVEDLKNEDLTDNHHNEEHQDHEEIKTESNSDVQEPQEDDKQEEYDEGVKEDYTKTNRSDDDVDEENPEDIADESDDHQAVKEEQQNDDAEEHPDESTDYEDDYDNNTDDDYAEEKKKLPRNVEHEDEDEDVADKPKDIYSNHRYEVTENAEIVEGDQTQQVKFPYGFFSPLTNLPYVQTPLPATQATPVSNLHTRVNYGFYSPFTGLPAPQPTRSLAPTFSPRLASLMKPRKNVGSFGYETMIYHHPGNNPERQAIQIKIYDGEISVPATNVKPQEEEKVNNVEYDEDDDEEDDDESGEVEEKQNLRQETTEDDSEEDNSTSSEESGEKKPSSSYREYKPRSSEDEGGNESAEEEDSDDLQSRLVTTSDVDNDAYYWL